LFRAFPPIDADENFFGSASGECRVLTCAEIMKEDEVVGVPRDLIISYLPASHGRL